MGKVGMFTWTSANKVENSNFKAAFSISPYIVFIKYLLHKHSSKSCLKSRSQILRDISLSLLMKLRSYQVL